MSNQTITIFTKVNTFDSAERRNNIFFFLADDIYHAYLSGLNTRMLLHEYGSYQQCPDELHVRVEAIESFFMTEVSSQYINQTYKNQ